jgi:hypothetical protein
VIEGALETALSSRLTASPTGSTSRRARPRAKEAG